MASYNNYDSDASDDIAAVGKSSLLTISGDNVVSDQESQVTDDDAVAMQDTLNGELWQCVCLCVLRVLCVLERAVEPRPTTSSDRPPHHSLSPSLSQTLAPNTTQPDAFTPVLRACVSKFVDIKLRLLKEHETVINDKDTMYTTKIRKMQAVIDGLTDDLKQERDLTESLNEEKVKGQLHAAEAHVKRALMRGGGASASTVVKLWAKYTREKKAERKMEGLARKWSRKNTLVKR